MALGVDQAKNSASIRVLIGWAHLRIPDKEFYALGIQLMDGIYHSLC